MNAGVRELSTWDRVRAVEGFRWSGERVRLERGELQPAYRRGNLPADVIVTIVECSIPKGNPEAIFDVVQLPTGEVISVKLRKSSGHRAYDEAVERAIHKSSPLPKPDAGMAFQRALELRFRPLD